MDLLLSIIESINDIMWGFALLFILCGTGIYFTFKLRFIQIRKFGESFKRAFGGIKFGVAAGKDGMSSFQSLATAIAAQVGTGNLAGAATAIASGGPGAIFWMWVSAFFGMATNFAEATAAQKFKTVDSDGAVIGGPAYYIRAGIKGPLGKFLATLFAVFLIVALGFFGIMVQSNSIGESFYNAFKFNPVIVGVLLSALVLIIVLGGVKRIASITEKVVPFMGLFYIIGSLIVLFSNVGATADAFRQIVVGAFSPKSVMGGAIGITIRDSIRYGVARGLFSNEAGMGSTPHAHALARVDHPCDQGLVAIVGVFIDTFVILNLTAFVVISSGAVSTGTTGILLTQLAFSSVFKGFGNTFIAICLFFFAFTTIIGWYFFGETNVKYLFGNKAVKVYAIIVGLFIVLGSALKVELVWAMADLFNGLMVIPNLIGLLAISGVIAALTKEHDQLKMKR